MKDQCTNILQGLQKWDSVCIDVQYEKCFVANILQRIRAFLSNHLFVRIVNEFSYCRLFFSEKYEKS